MHIKSIEALYDIAHLAWKNQQPFFAYIHGASEEILKQNFSIEIDKMGSLLHTMQYYQLIQKNKFYPALLNLADLSDPLQWATFKEWDHYNEQPLICIFYGPRTEVHLWPECVDYYLTSGSKEKIATASNQGTSLRSDLIAAFQHDLKSQPKNASDMMDTLIQHIIHHYPIHLQYDPTLQALERICSGLENPMAEKSILERMIKWSVFEYLGAIKKAQITS